MKTKQGCGKEINALGDIIVCGGVDKWLCPDCKETCEHKPKSRAEYRVDGDKIEVILTCSICNAKFEGVVGRR